MIRRKKALQDTTWPDQEPCRAVVSPNVSRVVPCITISVSLRATRRFWSTGNPRSAVETPPPARSPKATPRSALAAGFHSVVQVSRPATSSFHRSPQEATRQSPAHPRPGPPRRLHDPPWPRVSTLWCRSPALPPLHFCGAGLQTCRLFISPVAARGDSTKPCPPPAGSPKATPRSAVAVGFHPVVQVSRPATSSFHRSPQEATRQSPARPRRRERGEWTSELP